MGMMGPVGAGRSRPSIATLTAPPKTTALSLHREIARRWAEDDSDASAETA